MMILKNNPVQGLVKLHGSVERFHSGFIDTAWGPIFHWTTQSYERKYAKPSNLFQAHLSLFQDPKNYLFHIGAQ